MVGKDTLKSTKQISIIIIEDNRYMRESWNTILDFESDMNVIAVYNQCEDALTDGKLKSADIILLDISLPGMPGTEGVMAIREQNPEAGIIMATIHEEDEYIFKSLRNGAIGYLQKQVSATELTDAIRNAYAGGSPMSPSIARKVIDSFFLNKSADNSREKNVLTDKEQKVLQFLAEGYNYAAIGAQMHLSVDGVGYHIRNIYRKLEVNSRSQAVREGLRKRIIRFLR